jgi:hypothetical protein
VARRISCGLRYPFSPGGPQGRASGGEGFLSGFGPLVAVGARDLAIRPCARSSPSGRLTRAERRRASRRSCAVAPQRISGDRDGENCSASTPRGGSFPAARGLLPADATRAPAALSLPSAVPPCSSPTAPIARIAPTLPPAETPPRSPTPSATLSRHHSPECAGLSARAPGATPGPLAPAAAARSCPPAAPAMLAPPPSPAPTENTPPVAPTCFPQDRSAAPTPPAVSRFRDKLSLGASLLARYGVLAEPPYLIEYRSAFQFWLRPRRSGLKDFLPQHEARARCSFVEGPTSPPPAPAYSQ